MNLHRNAALSLKGRRELCRRVVSGERTLGEAAEAAEVSVRCARKWVDRYRAEGEAGLLDRSSAPRSVPHRTASSASRRSLRSGVCGSPAQRSPRCLGMPLSTVSGILTRIGLGKLGRLGLEPAQRYERQRPGELIHIDVKKLGRIMQARASRHRQAQPDPYHLHARRTTGRRCVGWEYVHIAIDDCTRLAYAEILCDEKATTVTAFLRRAVAFYARHGVTVEQLLTDNGSGYRSTIHAIACRLLGIRHLRTRAYRPQTNGKAERFIRTLLGGWAYGAHLPQQQRTSSSPRRLAVVLQPPTKTRSPRPQAPDRPPQRARPNPLRTYIYDVHTARAAGRAVGERLPCGRRPAPSPGQIRPGARWASGQGDMVERQRPM